MPSRSTQLPRAASLIISSLGFIHDLRTGTLEPDTVRGIPLDMDQYSRLFGTARIPTDHGCRMETASNSKQIIVLRRGQFCAVPYRHPINPIADDHTFPSSSQIGLTSWMSRTAHFLPNAKCFATCKRLSPMRTNCQHPRSLEMHLVFSPPRTARCGPACAAPSRRTVVTLHVSVWSIRRCSSSASMTPRQKGWRSFAGTSCVVLIVLSGACR